MGNNSNKFCGQTNTPTVNEENIKCDEYILSDCVIYEDSIPFLGITPNSNITNIVDSIVNRLKDTYIDIDNLSNIIGGFETVNKEDFTFDDLVVYTDNNEIIVPLNDNNNVNQILLVIINGSIISQDSYHYDSGNLVITIIDDIEETSERFPLSVIYKY